MRTTIFNENDRVLLIGEGNFSFSTELVNLNLGIDLTATCYESNIAYEAGKKNIAYLRNNGWYRVRVLLGVDARKLTEHPILKLESFNKIMFNFPHVGGKMKIDQNRELLKQFFMSAEKLVKTTGQILVTLCNGQGGTPADNPQRRWDDSWKIVEMAAYGNCLLTAVEPFMFESFKNYTNVGYRSLEKGFNIDHSLIHFFHIAEPPNEKNIASGIKIDDRKSTLCGISWKELVSSVRKEDISQLDVLSIYPLDFEFDITFSVNADFDETVLFVILYNFAGSIIDDVKFLGFYEFPDTSRVTRTYRITYKSLHLPMYRKRIIDVHTNVIAKILEDNLNVLVT